MARVWQEADALIASSPLAGSGLSVVPPPVAAVSSVCLVVSGCRSGCVHEVCPIVSDCVRLCPVVSGQKLDIRARDPVRLVSGSVREVVRCCPVCVRCSVRYCPEIVSDTCTPLSLRRARTHQQRLSAHPGSAQSDARTLMCHVQRSCVCEGPRRVSPSF